MKFLFSILVLVKLFLVDAQVYLNDTATYNSNWCGYLSVFELNSNFYTMGNIIRGGHDNDLSLTLSLHTINGSKILLRDDYDPLNDQRVFGGINKLIYNERGNFVYLYNNCEQGVSCYPRLKEISPTGLLINDISYLPILDSLNLELLDFNNIIQKKDSSYVIAADIYDSLRLLTPNLGGGGILYIHLDKDFNVMDTVPYFGTSNHANRGYAYADIAELDNGNIVFMIYETLQASDPESQIVFITIDEQGNILNKKHYTDGQMAGSPFALTRTEDNGFLFTYVKSVNIDNSWINNDYLCKVDSNFNLVWKMSVDTLIHSGGFKYLEKNIAPTLDGSYITAGGSGTFEPDYQSTALLSKFDKTGQITWQRHHFLLSEVSPTAPITTEINDVIATSDSGYCMVGQVFDYPAFVAGSPISFYGYLVKTNCLGFLGNAVASAGFSYEDDFAVSFYNTSMQAGSYFWDFGDGTTLITDEYTDTVVHQYPVSGVGHFDTYEVMLIAYGCYDSLGVRDADTLLFTVQPKKHQDPSVVTNGNGSFTIFPNPISVGSPLYVYLNGLNANDGEVILKIYGNDGRYVTKYILSASEGSYQIDNHLSSGIYMLVLEQGGEVLEVEKLVVR